MLRSTSTVALLATIMFAIGNVNAMDCTGSSKNFIEEIVNSCPKPFFPNKEYCCYKLDGSSYCCDEAELLQTPIGLALLIAGIIVILIILSCCISCICCSCCPWYQRRHRGVVYGNSGFA